MNANDGFQVVETVEQARMMGEQAAEETAELIKGADLMAWASAQFVAAAEALKAGNRLMSAQLAAAGMRASELA